MSDPKTARLEIVLTPELKAAAQAAASRYGITVSDYVRVLLGLVSGFDPQAVQTIQTFQILQGGKAPRKKRSRRST